MKKTVLTLPILERGSSMPNITLREVEDYMDYAENNNLDIDIYNLMRKVLGINYYIPVDKPQRDDSID